eukprot:gene9235-12449_t
MSLNLFELSMDSFLWPHILSEWITIVDLAHLDTAVCSRTLREFLLSVYCHPHFSSMSCCSLPFELFPSYFNWIAVKGIKLNELRLTPEIYQRSQRMLNNMDFSLLETFSIYAKDEREIISVKDLENIIIRSPRLKSVSFINKKVANLSDTVIVLIANHCRNLESITYNGNKTNQITDQSILVLATRCMKLISISLSNCLLVSNNSVECISRNCPGLELIHLSSCLNVTDSSIISLAERCSSLHSVDIGYCSAITDDAIISLVTRCANLKLLILNNCYQITNLAMHYIAVTRLRLEKISVNGCVALDNIALMYLIEGCKNHLKTIFAYGTSINYVAVVEAFISCSKLQNLVTPSIEYKANDRALQLKREQLANDDDLARILNCIPSLKSVVILGWTQLTNQSIITLAHRFPDLRLLYIREFPNLNDQTLISMARKCKELNELNVSGCTLLTDESLIGVAANCRGLKALNISQCINITDQGIIRIAEVSPKLNSLYISGCNNISENAMMCIVDLCPHLDHNNLLTAGAHN